MTDHDALPDADPVDELASALLDGEATADEQARAADPQVAARLAAFRAVRERVAAPVPRPDDARRDAAIAAALGAMAPAPATGEVVAMRRRVPRWLPAAAAAAVVLGIGALVAGLRAVDDDADTVASGVPESDEDSATTSDASTEGDASSGGAAESAPSAGATAMAAPVPDLGDLDATQLPDALRSATTPDGADGDPGAVARDTGVPCADRFGTSLVAVATARVDGVAVTVGVLDDEGGSRYVALDQGDCERRVAAGEL